MNTDPGHIQQLKSDAQQQFRNNRLMEAKTLFTRAGSLDPSDPDIWHMLSAINGMLGKFEESETCARKVLELNPNAIPAYNNLGSALLAQNKTGSARVAFESALKLEPGNPETLTNLGNICLRDNEFLMASGFYRKAIAIRPDHTEACNNLGSALLSLCQPEAALRYLQTAIRLNPRYPDALFNLARTYHALGNHTHALNTYNRILQLQPGHTDALFGIGDLLRDQGHYHEAIRHYENLVHNNPADARILGALADVKNDCGLNREACSLYRQAIGLDPEIPNLFDNFLLALHYDEQPNETVIAGCHMQYGEMTESKYTPAFRFSDNRSNERITIGYVSNDFRTHSVAYFFEPVITEHDSREFRVICYANMSKDMEDATTQRIRGCAEVWRDISPLGDRDAATLIFNDGVDILVDLAGHTARNRLTVFALRPAPVQITYLGYPDTTGLHSIDYRITDLIADPSDTDASRHSERLVYLPGGFLTYRPPSITAEPVADRGTANGLITLGSFNKLAKISDATVALWSSILDSVPNSGLLLKNRGFTDRELRESFTRRFADRGIDPDRLRLLPPARSLEDHMALYNKIDIALDTYPYNGTTTTCEALWMGTPVITLAGTTHVSRVGCSLLNQLGLDELVTHGPDSYIETAARLAQNHQQLRKFHRTLRRRMSTSRLVDHKTFTNKLERLYHRIWLEHGGPGASSRPHTDTTKST